MKSSANHTDIVRAHVSAPPGMMFHGSLASVRQDVAIESYVSVIDRAWREMKLQGVLCLDGRPVLYLKEYGRPFSVAERLRLQKLFWNQGVANVLVLIDPTSVYIYSGLVKPSINPPDEEAAEAALIEALERAEYVQGIQTFYHALATGRYYEKNRNHFDPGHAVDSWLLNNLRDFRDDLIDGEEGMDLGEAHAFIGRILFICYLLDRGVVSIGKPGRGETGTMRFADELAKRSPGSQIGFLYDLFENLKDRFNGNMFDQDLESEKNIIRPHLEKLLRFFGGHHVKSGQTSLFWPYDFKMIPVETISAIYQDFLAAENPKGQRKRGAFYTPRFLAETVVDMAIREEADAWNWKYLDPACGSGIFLVILFSRLAAHRLGRLENIHYVKKAETLQNILANQIRGVDIEETACRIACFSLYLAYLDFFDPPDVENYIKKTGKKLPRFIDYGDDSEKPAADIPVIGKADFLKDGVMGDEQFDCVIGNPPWEGRGTKQLAQKFLEKAPFFLKGGGIGCLLLPTKILQNQTDAFQAEWLRRVTLEEVLQLADYSFLLFHNALCPAIISKFRNFPLKNDFHMVEFKAPKFNRDGLRQGVIIVNPSSRTWIPLSDILAATQTKTAPVVWKRRLWGTPRDQKLLDLLQSLPSLSELAGEPKKGKRWIKGQGLQPYYPEKAMIDSRYPKAKPNPWKPTDLFILASQDIQSVAIQEECTTLEKRLNAIGASQNDMRRAPDPNLFKSPMVLASQGFGKVAYCDFDVLFQDSLQSISGPPEDTELLMFLAGYLRSNLAKYFLFHTAANWGSERDKVHLNELLRVPFPLPGDDFVSSDAMEIVKKVAGKFHKLREELKKIYETLKADAKRYSFFDDAEVDERQWRVERKKFVDSVHQEIEPLIYRYFGLTDQEIEIIEDTVRVFIPSSTPGTWNTSQTLTLDPVDRARVEPYAEKALAAYANTLTGTMNSWAGQEGSAYRVCAEGGTDRKTGLAMVTVSISDSATAFAEKTISVELAEVLRAYYESISETAVTLIYHRDILFFQDERIHIVRPNILLNWTRTAALNDAARIYGEIAMAETDYD